MAALSPMFLLLTLSAVSADYSSTVHVVVAPPAQPQGLLQPQGLPQPQQPLSSYRPWHLNRVDCILADLVPKVSQRIKLLKFCENEFFINPQKRPSYKKKTPYLGWRYTAVVDVWAMDSLVSKDLEYSPLQPRGHGKFTESLYKNLEEVSPNTVSTVPGNVAVSPLAVEVALACLLLGARFDTRKEINRFLDVTPDSLPLKYHSIISQLQLKKQKSIRLVNRLHLEESFFPVKEDFSRQLYEVFETRIEKANFHAGAPAELEKINNFVAQNTEGHISDALTSEVVNEHTQLLLVNTLYFQAKWENQFHVRNGFNGDFFLPDGKTVTATYMTRDQIFYHYKENKRRKYRMLELPFQSETDDPGLYSMIVILPDEVDGLENVEEHLTSDHSWLKDFDLVSIRDTDIVKATIPRFTIDSKTNLKIALNKMNVFHLFEDNSDFGNISDRKNIKTSKLYQRIYLDVNEKGANVSPRPKSLPGTGKESRKHPVEFYAKHPFMFAVVQRVTKSILIMGRVMKPNFDEFFANNSENEKK